MATHMRASLVVDALKMAITWTSSARSEARHQRGNVT
jgi:hypothetical protein